MEALQGYGSSSEDASSANSSASETSDQATCSPSSKRLRLSVPSEDGAPALPASTQASTPARTSLLPPAAALLEGSYSPPPAHQQRQLEQALHQGRTRTFPHVEGNYATHVYIAVATPPSALAALGALLRVLSTQLPSLQPVVHGPAGEPRSSLTGAIASSNIPCQASHRKGTNGSSSVRPSAAATGLAAAAGPAEQTARPAPVPAPPLAQRQYHVSLSRTVPLRRHQIEPLVQALRQRLRQQDTFCIQMGQPEIFVNDERTRTFLSLAATQGSASAPGSPRGSNSSSKCGGSSGSDQPVFAEVQGQQQQKQQAQREAYCPQLVSLCHAVSAVFAEHGLPRFYADPRPHASVAWLLGDQQQQLEQALASPEGQQAAGRLAALRWQLRPAAIVCKAGQREYPVWEAAPHGA